jgi:cytochrome P450
MAVALINPIPSGCPHSAVGEAFNPFYGSQLDDPYPFYARARRQQPVFFSPLLKMWYVTRYDDVVAVLNDPARFSSADAVNVPLDYTPETRRAIEESFLSRGSLTNNDPPSHAVIRRMVNRAFQHREREAGAASRALHIRREQVKPLGRLWHRFIPSPRARRTRSTRPWARSCK